MVTANVEDLSSAFEGVVEDRDITGAAVIGTTAALGGVLATQAAGRLVPALGFQSTGGGAVDMILTGTVKMIAGAVLGLIGIRVGGTPGLMLALAGFGGLVLGGGNWINAILSTDVGATAARRGGVQSGNRRVASVSRNGSASTTANAASNVDVASSSSGSPLDDLMA